MSNNPGHCSQTGCEEEAVFYYTWPGESESLACLRHANAITYLAWQLGIRVPMFATFDRPGQQGQGEPPERGRVN